MKKKLFTIFIAVMSFLSLQLTAQDNKQIKNWADGQIYVKINDNVNVNLKSDGSFDLENLFLNKELIEKYQITKVKFPFSKLKSDILNRTVKIYFNNYNEIQQIIKELNENSFVDYVEKVPNFTLFTVPDDPYYNQEVTGYGSLHIDMMGTTMDMGPYDFGTANSSWHLNVINAEAAWDLQAGDPNIIVADLDNGIWTQHPDLQNVIAHEYDVADDDNNATPPVQGYEWSHGTHTAGLIAAENNNGIGVASIGNGISLMAIKIQTDDSEDMSSGIDAIAYAVENGAKIISMSWGAEDDGTSAMLTMENMVNYAWDAGLILLASAGNNGDGSMNTMGLTTNALMYPAAYSNVIAVGSTNSDDTKSPFSQYGTWVDVLSPGGFANSGYNMSGTEIGQFTVLSTTYSVATDINVSLSDFSQEGGGAAYYGVSGNYDIMPGTSMSCPIAAGLCGLIWSVNPTFTNTQVRNILESTCDNVDALNPNFVDSIGYGRINALAAIQAAKSIPEYNVSGNITFNSTPLENVTITYTGGVTTTDVDGNYSFLTAEESNQNIVPSKTGYAFTPSEINLLNIISDTANHNFVATEVTTYTVSGYITNASVGLANVNVNYTGGSTTTDVDGYYSFIVDEGSNTVITPSLNGNNFIPSSISLTNILEDTANNNFEAIPTFIVSGKVTDVNSQPVESVIINYGTGSTVTNAQGEYSFTADLNAVYTITPSLTIAFTTYSFTPENITTNAITEDLPNQDFIMDNVTSIIDNDLSKINIYPNPAKDVINIANCINANYELFDMLGAKVSSGKITNDNFELNVDNLKMGNYLLVIKNNKDLKNLRIIKY